MTKVTPAIPIKTITEDIKNKTMKNMKNNLQKDKNKYSRIGFIFCINQK